MLSAADVRRFTPASYEGREGAPVYLLAPMSWRTRGKFRAALMGEGIRYPQDAEMAKTAREIVAELAPDNAADLNAVLDTFLDQRTQPAPDAPAAEAPAEEQEAFLTVMAARHQVEADYEALIDRLRQHPKIGFLLALRTAFNELAPPLAASYALVGWENVAQPFRRLNGVVPDEVLDALPRADLGAIGSESLMLIAVSEAQRGN